MQAGLQLVSPAKVPLLSLRFLVLPLWVQCYILSLRASFPLSFKGYGSFPVFLIRFLFLPFNVCESPSQFSVLCYTLIPGDVLYRLSSGHYSKYRSPAYTADIYFS